MKRTAFTLLELLLVLAIIATICGLGITSYQRQYARAQFKSGVVQIQTDLHRTRLLAMKSGEAYFFRYVPGTCVYEIAPLKTLQEVLYRIRGEAEDSIDDSLGGSLSLDSTNASAFPSETVYSDDLFSTENIEADAALQNRVLNESNQLGQSVDSFGLGGNLSSFQGTNDDGLSSINGATVNGGVLSSSGSSLGIANSSYGSLSEASSVSINCRELNAQEKSLAKENSIAWRVNNDGVIVRKQASGDVVFTFLRTSKTTPSNLRTQRPKGSSVDGSSSGIESGSDFSTEKALGGSLTSVPDGSERADDLGGGLNEVLGQTNTTSLSENLSSENKNVSVWSEPIVFYPNGKTSSAVFGLESIGDYSYYSEIAIRGMTGVARISSISSVPPGAGSGSSVLTQEQLFRLSNPMNGAVNQNAGVATSGVLDGVKNESSFEATYDLSTSLGNLSELNAPTDGLVSGERQTSIVNYGTGRRSGYSFNENVDLPSSDSPLGVSLGQSATSTLNNQSEVKNVGASDGGTVGSNQAETTDNFSTLNGGTSYER